MKLSVFFEKNPRGTWSTTKNAPKWLNDAIREAHAGDLPDDWTYETCRAVCDAIDDEAIASGYDVHEFADGQVDVYTRDLAQWYADHCDGSLFSQAESDADDMGQTEQTVNERLTTVQFCAIARIASTLWEAYEENGTEE